MDQKKKIRVKKSSGLKPPAGNSCDTPLACQKSKVPYIDQLLSRSYKGTTIPSDEELDKILALPSPQKERELVARLCEGLCHKHKNSSADGFKVENKLVNSHKINKEPKKQQPLNEKCENNNLTRIGLNFDSNFGRNFFSNLPDSKSKRAFEMLHEWNIQSLFQRN